MAYKGKKIAFLFPGQGAQYVGMASDIISEVEDSNCLLEDFDKKHKTNLKEIMLKGPEEKLKETQFTQPAILFHSTQILKEVKKRINILPDYVAGHSLGEFSALVANGVLSEGDAMHLVHKRGQFMIRANSDKPFAMAALVGLSPGKVEELCEEGSKTDIVIAANFNTPVQTVISGSKKGVDKVVELAKENGAKRIVPLIVGGPFHSPLISKAKEWLLEEMDGIEFSDTSIPVVANVDAEFTKKGNEIRGKLGEQIISSVQWVKSIELLLSEDVDIFIEFGPQKVLTGMMRKIDRKANIINVDKISDISLLIEKLEEFCL